MVSVDFQEANENECRLLRCYNTLIKAQGYQALIMGATCG